jgi:xylulokinase
LPLYLGFDASTQSLTAVVIEIEGALRRLVHADALIYDEELPHYGTRHGVLPDHDPRVGVSPPLMWAEALDRMMARLAMSGVDLLRIDAISGAGQQHGSVYLSPAGDRTLGRLDPARPLTEQLGDALSRGISPIWIDTTTAEECAEITARVGGEEALARHTGSRAFERFTGPQIRRFAKRAPEDYQKTSRIHLVSSFMASLLAGVSAPLEPGDASGMNLMDLRTRDWWAPALDATAPRLAAKLPPIVAPWSQVGTLASYWQSRYGFGPAPVIAWTGDNPSSLVGTGLVAEGRLAISLGTSDTVFASMATPDVDQSGTGHVFGASTGAFMGLTCFQNGSLAREQVRRDLGLSWLEFSGALAELPPGSGGRVMLPWFSPEITPAVSAPGVRRYGPPPSAASDVRAVIEAQMLSMALHCRWMAPRIDTIHATGGAAVNRDILQVMADVFGADVYQVRVGNSAALGAALRAAHARLRERDPSTTWTDVVAGFTESDARSRIAPQPDRHAFYRGMLEIYAACEAHALNRGPDPSPLLDRLASRERRGGEVATKPFATRHTQGTKQ